MRHLVINKFDEEKILDFQDKKFINIKDILKSPAGHTLLDNCMKVSLLMKEEKVAAVILCEYNIRVDHLLFRRAVTSNAFVFLRYMWQFKKNYVILNGEQVKLPMRYLFNMVLKTIDKNAESKIKEIMDWKIVSDEENLTRLLLEYQFDAIATLHVEEREGDVTIDLLKYAIENENEFFMEYCLKHVVFPPRFLEDLEIVETILNLFEKGEKIDYICNILTFANFSKWTLQNNQRLLHNINKIVITNDEKNYILLTANTLMTLAHC